MERLGTATHVSITGIELSPPGGTENLSVPTLINPLKSHFLKYSAVPKLCDISGKYRASVALRVRQIPDDSRGKQLLSFGNRTNISDSVRQNTYAV